MNQEIEPLGADVLEGRHALILKLLGEEGSVKVADLSRRYGVSEVTIRADLERLARQGLLARYRGGAVARVQTTHETAYTERLRHRREEKTRIARRAAQMIHPGDAILLDAGTTVMELAKELDGISPLTVVTNALNTASVISAFPGIHVIVAGGSISTETVSTVGHIAERDIENLLVDKLFLGTHSFDPELGILDASVEVSRVKTAMIKAARQVILLCDSSKFRRRAFAKVAPLTAVDILISDIELAHGDVEEIQGIGVEVVLV